MLTIKDELQYIKKMAQRYQRPGILFEDLVQAGYLGVMRAKEDYDPTRGSFLWYASFWIQHEMADLSRKERKHGLCMEYEDDLVSTDPTQSRDESIDLQTNLNRLKVAFACMRPDWREAVEACEFSEYGEAKAKIRAIRERDGISYCMLYKRRTNGLKQLKELMNVNCPSAMDQTA